MTGLDLNAIDEPLNMTGAELLDLLYADRGLAIALAEYHGLIGNQGDEPPSITAKWLSNLISGPCSCCGRVHTAESANLHGR